MINNPVCGPESLLIYGVHEEDVETSTNSNGGNFLFNLSVLKEKVHQLQSLTTMFIEKCSDYSTHHQQLSDQSTAEVIASNMGTLIQNIIVAASSLMFTCQKISLSLQATPSPLTNNHSANKTSTTALHSHHQPDRPVLQQENDEGLYSNNEKLDRYGNGYMNGNINSNEVGRGGVLAQEAEHSEGLGKFSAKYNCDIVELDAADLLAKYTHYCQVCGKGFKRDANLRMHMRAHGDEYKSPAALSSPLKKSTDDHLGENAKLPRKYSCPQEGCRWNKKHPKFQPLKSMTCVKNHYKRSHCPKMYACKRCNRKHFSVLSDLRTHEKHCGDLKWMCSCGNSFSRKDKLLGHVALFVGHTPAASSLVKMGKVYDQSPGQMQSDERFDFI